MQSPLWAGLEGPRLKRRVNSCRWEPGTEEGFKPPSSVHQIVLEAVSSLVPGPGDAGEGKSHNLPA